MIGEIRDRDAAGIEVADHVLQGAAHEEVLLLQAQAPTLIRAVVGIEHLGEGLGAHLFLYGAVIVAAVEGIEVKRFGGIGSPQPQPVAGVNPIAQHRHVVGNADSVLCWNPAHPVGAVLIAVALGVATEAHEAGLIGVG